MLPNEMWFTCFSHLWPYSSRSFNTKHFLNAHVAKIPFNYRHLFCLELTKLPHINNIHFNIVTKDNTMISCIAYFALECWNIYIFGVIPLCHLFNFIEIGISICIYKYLSVCVFFSVLFWKAQIEKSCIEIWII